GTKPTRTPSRITCASRLAVPSVSHMASRPSGSDTRTPLWYSPALTRCASTPRSRSASATRRALFSSIPEPYPPLRAMFLTAPRATCLGVKPRQVADIVSQHERGWGWPRIHGWIGLPQQLAAKEAPVTAIQDLVERNSFRAGTGPGLMA